MLTGFQQILQQLRVQAPFSGFTRTASAEAVNFVTHGSLPVRS